MVAAVVGKTDVQWERLRAAGIGTGPDPGTQREIANALLYRERAKCPWHLMPDGFPPLEALRAAAAAWRADGTWKKLIEIVTANRADPVRPAESPAQRFSRKVKTRIKSLPAATALVYPARGVMRLTKRMIRCRRGAAGTWRPRRGWSTGASPR